MVKLEEIRPALERCIPPERLNRRVVERMRAMRAEEERKGDSMGASLRAAAVSRRRFIALGTAGCASLGAAGAGLAGWLRASNPRGEGGDAIVAASSGSLHPFGLTVAQASEPGEAVVLQARPDGLMPIGDTTSWHIEFKLNLSCSGEGIETVTYSLIGGAVEMLQEYSDLERPGATGAAFNVVVDPRIHGSEELEQAYAWFDEQIESGGTSETTFSFEYSAEPDWDGTMVHEWGEAYRALGVTFWDAFWSSDDVLAAKRAWLDAEVSGKGSTVALAAQETYESLFSEVAVTNESMATWLRSINRSSLGFAADVLAQVVLQVDATFTDGSTARKSYRLEPVEGFADVVDARFDALVERYGLGAEAFNPRIAPFWNFSGYVPAEDEADERLVAPLFAIVDITGELEE